MSDPLRVLILGAGGHGQVVAEALLAACTAGTTVRPIGFLDDDPTLEGQIRLGLPVLGPPAVVTAHPHDAVVVGIGNNWVRRRLAEAMLARGEQLVTCCHPRAYIAAGAVLGAGTVVCAGAVVGTGARIGANVILNTSCTVDHHTTIGDYAHIAPGVHLGGDVTVGVATLVGIGAVVLPGRHVGTGCVVGAGAVVVRDVLDGVVVMGTPARPVSLLHPIS